MNSDAVARGNWEEYAEHSLTHDDEPECESTGLLAELDARAYELYSRDAIDPYADDERDFGPTEDDLTNWNIHNDHADDPYEPEVWDGEEAPF